jgi:hypothetical protein
MGAFLVAWIFPSFHLYLFLVEDLVENHVFLKELLQEKKVRRNKRRMKFFWKLSSQISVGCFDILTKTLAIMESS